MKALNTYKSENKKDSFKEMYLDSTDPIRIAENVRKNSIKKQLSDKRKDTGC